MDLRQIIREQASKTGLEHFIEKYNNKIVESNHFKFRLVHTFQNRFDVYLENLNELDKYFKLEKRNSTNFGPYYVLVDKNGIDYSDLTYYESRLFSQIKIKDECIAKAAVYEFDAILFGKLNFISKNYFNCICFYHTHHIHRFS